MNYSGIKYFDIANGSGVRTVLFVSGCRHHCPYCFNPDTWSFEAGDPFTSEVEDEIIESMKPAYVDGLTVLGGEPMEAENQAAVLHLLERMRAELPGKGAWLYSGFTWEQLVDGPSRAHSELVPRILACLDVLVDGPFVQDLKDITLRFRGSSNQRLIDVPRTLAEGQVCLWEDDPVFSSHSW